MDLYFKVKAIGEIVGLVSLGVVVLGYAISGILIFFGGKK